MTDTTSAAPSEREQFEAHAKDQGYKLSRGPNGSYQYHDTAVARRAWLAARRAQPTPPAAALPEPDAWRYTDARGHFRYRGLRPDFDADYAILQPVALYSEATVRSLLAATPPAVVEPLTPIRQAALDLYTPPFRHEHGYIRDANNQMVADDAGSEALGLIAARIRGWGRIQYLDNPEGRAGALQDEVAEMVAEALNAFWAAHGIKGDSNG